MLAPDFGMGSCRAGCEFAPRPRHLLHRDGVRQDGQRLDEALPFLGRDEDTGGQAVSGDLKRLTALLRRSQELQQRVLGLAGSQRRHVVILMTMRTEVKHPG
jgi:hypothetical protein